MNITLHLKIWGPTVTAEADVYTALKYHIDVDEYGTRRYYNVAGRLHRDNGPAVEYASGSKAWYQNGKRHRDVGPAVERMDDIMAWYQNGRRHRVDGPAIVHANGAQEWYHNGRRHRLDGPAIVHANGAQEWWINGTEYSSAEDFYSTLAKLKAHT